LTQNPVDSNREDSVAINWILDYMSQKPGVDVGSHQFTDLVYTDDTTYFVSSLSATVESLSNFNHLSSTLGLCISWTMTKIQNIGSGPQPSDVTVDGNTVEQVETLYT